MKAKCRAKINLSIDVLGKLPNGYHKVEMIMQSIDLYDVIEINNRDDGKILIHSKSHEIPLTEDNIVYKAANLLKKKYNVEYGADIVIEKNIPVAAGMAGGSTDAAGTIKLLNILWNLNLSEEQMKKDGLQIGADVPFCISGGAVLAENIGEELTDIKGLDNSVHVLVCKPEIFVSTGTVYREIDSTEIVKRPDNKFLINALKEGNVNAVAENMYNVLEGVTEKMHAEINKIEGIMIRNGAMGAMMSGSGPTVFGLYDNFEKANLAKQELLKEFRQVYLVKSAERGIEVHGEYN